MLFGSSDPGFDPGDAEARAAYFAAMEDDDDDDDGLAGSLDEVLANQIAGGEPPAVSAAALRLLGAGVAPASVMGQLRAVLLSALLDALDGDERPAFGGDLAAPAMARYQAALDRLPLPGGDDLQAALLSVVRAQPRITIDEAFEAALGEIGAGSGDRLSRSMLGYILDDLTEEEEILALLPGDRLVHLGDLLAGTVLTRRLNAEEIESDVLDLSFDLAPLSAVEAAVVDGTEVEIVEWSGGIGWHGPAGWLRHHSPGSLVSVTMISAAPGEPGEARIDGPLEPREPEGDLIEAVRDAYDQTNLEAGLPVEGRELLVSLLAADPARWHAPQPPLHELCSAAGLERRGHQVAHSEEVWAAAASFARRVRVGEALDDTKDIDTVLDALAAFEDPAASAAQLRASLRAIAAPELRQVTAEELSARSDAHGGPDPGPTPCERAVAAAVLPGELIVAHWLAAVVAERNGDPHLASAHLDLGLEADDRSPVLLDRAAWYASDRGDAPAALALWRRLGPAGRSNADAVAPYAASVAPVTGRNDPCWCGSGRKYKYCHRGQPRPLPLSERVGWLCQKATWYLERRGGEAAMDVIGLAATRAVAAGEDPDEVLESMLSDPVVIDVALTEGGWWKRFLAERAALLPDDEAMMAESWSMVERTLYEVVSSQPGVGLVVRDLRSAEVVEVTERSFSTQARAGQVVCARAVPVADEGHQLVGAVFPVAAGTESRLLDILDGGDPFELCRWVGALDRPPHMLTREGEAIVECVATLRVGDPTAARAWLERTYEPDGDDAWSEMHPLGDEERILRAQLTLQGDQLRVETASEERMDRVLAAVTAAVPDAEVLSDLRRPLDPGELPAPPAGMGRGGPGLAAGGLKDLPAGALDDLQDTMERRWLGEQIPALGGLTPRQAASDPAARETLVRLIDGFPDPASLPAGAFSMRPERLRQELGLR